jgi:hypothetical protein
MVWEASIITYSMTQVRKRNLSHGGYDWDLMIGTSHPIHTHPDPVHTYTRCLTYSICVGQSYDCGVIIPTPMPLTLIALTLASTQTQSVMSLISTVLYPYNL